MTTRIGCCNWKLFSIPDSSGNFRRTGPLSEDTRHLEIRQERQNINRLMRSEAPGAFWSWEYDSESEEPQIWVIRNTSTNAVLYGWEAETAPVSTPIVSQQVGLREGVQDILPANSEIVQAIIPFKTEIDSVESLVAAATLPTFIDPRFDWCNDAATLLMWSFDFLQNQRGMDLYSTITVAHQKLKSVQRTRMYSLLWLRCASAIILDYPYFDTMIPLIMDKMLVDANGVFSMKP